MSEPKILSCQISVAHHLTLFAGWGQGALSLCWLLSIQNYELERQRRWWW